MGAPRWRRALDEVELADGRLWSSYTPAGLAAVAGGGVLVADAANNEVLAIDSVGHAVALAGGLGQGPGELFTPGDVVAAGDGAVVADRNNSRLVALALPAVSEASRLVLPGVPLRLAAAGGTLHALTLVPTAGLRLLRVVGCCVSPVVDTVALSPAARTPPRSMAALRGGSVALLSVTGELALYGADGALTRVVHFAGDSAAGRHVVAVAGTSSARRLLVSLGDAVGCFDVGSGALYDLWQPPANDRGWLATVSLVTEGESGIYTYQPEGHVLARYNRRC